MTTALVCIALLGLLLFGLGFAVSMTRGQTRRIIGYSDDPADRLHKLVRAHGNTAEYAPFLALLIWVLGSSSPATWVLWCMGIATAARYLFVAGMVMSPTLAKPHPLRALGAVGTYLSGIALSAALLSGLSG
jgi:uncharacterized membrane protein YecN with MAPEG domain